MRHLFVFCFLSMALWLQPVHAQERFLPFWECVDRVTPATTADGLSLKLGYYQELAPNQFAANGLLGYHVTWIVLLDFNQTPIAVYETYEPDGSHPFGRIGTPLVLQRGFTECGADWPGLWTGPWPDQTPTPSPPPLDGLPPITELAIEDLLPPRSGK